ncbi:hypothetical protein ABPG74_020618 [Tetrahymena malaccensis]
MFQSKQVNQKVEKNTQYLSIYLSPSFVNNQYIKQIHKQINIEIKSMFEQAYQKSTNQPTIHQQNYKVCLVEKIKNTQMHTKLNLIHTQLINQVSKQLQVSKQINKQAKKEQSCINSSQIYL